MQAKATYDAALVGLNCIVAAAKQRQYRTRRKRELKVERERRAEEAAQSSSHAMRQPTASVASAQWSGGPRWAHVSVLCAKGAIVSGI